MNTALLIHKGTIKRQSMATNSEFLEDIGFQEQTIASNVPCRLDLAARLRFGAEQTEAATRTALRRALIYMNPGKYDGILDEQCWVEINGRKWQIISVMEVYGASNLDHYELDVEEATNR